MRLWVLSASTGGGHDMRAFALQEWWHQMGGVCEVFHPLENSFWGYKAGCQLYNIIQKKLPLLHHTYFHFLEFASLHRHPSFIVGAKKFIRKFKAFSPDIIVSTHAHLNHGFFQLTKNPNMQSSRFVVFCGELADGQGFSRHWINPQNDLFVSPFEEGYLAAIKRGMPKEKILVSGPLLRRPFYAKQTKFDRFKVMEEFGLDAEKPIFLLGTGANGVNHHLPVIEAILKHKIDCQILALCGKNQKTFNEIQKLSMSVGEQVLPLSRLDGNAMVKLLKVCNWMLARPGAGLTTEAIVTGCPVIFDLSGGTMPQEKNNLNFWKKRTGNLLTCRSPSQLVKMIQSKTEVPRLNIPLDSSPQLLLRALSQLIEK
jgi:processive 1,2-diacylglycerol beta-glucosyltransferase